MDGFACRLKRIREAAGLSLAEVAERAGVSKTYLWELEKDEAGERSPSVDVAKRVAAALGVGLLDLVGDDEKANLREQLIRRACVLMGWDYHTSPVWTGLRKVALAEAVPISLEKLAEMLNRIEKSAVAIALTDTGSAEFRNAFPPINAGTLYFPREDLSGWRVVEKIREILLDG